MAEHGDLASGTSGEEALEEVWRALRDHYPLMEYVGAGQAWVEELRPRVQTAKDLAAAFPIIEELVLRFGDCHTRLHWPGKPQDTSPDVRLGWVEEGLAILAAGADPGLSTGDRVLAVDGVEVSVAIEAVWARSQGSSRDAHLRSACERLLSGPPGTSLRLTTERGETALMRPAPGQRRPGAAPEMRLDVLPEGDAAVLRIPAWGGSDGFIDRLDHLLEDVRHLPHLVVDVRGNPGGDDALGRALVGRFVAEPFLCSICFYRTPTTQTYQATFARVEPRGPWRYSGRVAVLIDERCYSACTHFAAAMRASGVACLLGLPTNGGGAFMQRIDLASGATLICSRGFPIDGGVGGVPSPLHGTEPHIRVPPNLGDLRAGRDATLLAALEWLRSGRPIP